MFFWFGKMVSKKVLAPHFWVSRKFPLEWILFCPRTQHVFSWDHKLLVKRILFPFQKMFPFQRCGVPKTKNDFRFDLQFPNHLPEKPKERYWIESHRVMWDCLLLVQNKKRLPSRGFLSRKTPTKYPNHETKQQTRESPQEERDKRSSRIESSLLCL